MELAFEPDAGGVGPAEEFVGNQAVVDAEPVRELTLGASHGGQRRDADADVHEPVEAPGEVARAHDLRRIALRCVRRPDVEVVAHLRREEPPRERREELLQLDVLAPLNGLRVAEGVDVGLVQIPLVQIPPVAEKPEIDLALLAVDEQEADVRNVRERLGLRRLRCHGGAGAELGAAAVGHPDAGLVVAPGPSEQTRRVAHRSQQHDALRGIGSAAASVRRASTSTSRSRQRPAPGWRSGLLAWPAGVDVVWAATVDAGRSRRSASKRRTDAPTACLIAGFCEHGRCQVMAIPSIRRQLVDAAGFLPP